MAGNGGGKQGIFSSGTKGMILRIRKAIILYPSLMTPAVVSGSDYIYLMLLEQKKKPLTVHDINWQLKIMPGLDPAKNYLEEPLFKKDPEKFITILGRYDLKDKINGIKEKFAGVVDERARKVFKKAGFDKIVNIRLQNSMMKEDGVYNAFWVFSADSRYQTQVLDPETEEGPKVRTLNHDAMGKRYANELQDLHMQEVVKEMSGDRIRENGCYAFRVGARDVDPAATDTLEPIQSYHPVFYYGKLDYAGIGHMGDIHLSSRQNLLAKSRARVIDYCSKDEDGNLKEGEMNVSPEIGSMVNICSRNLKEILDKMGDDRDIQIVLISGDLIDYIRNLYMDDVEDLEEYNPTVREIWDRVKLDGKYRKRYQKFVDSISVYSLIVNFCRNYQKPVFVVSGNHDCYREPYGIAPRIKIAGCKTNIRANEGIPADHNLTIYEAILIFGDSYRKIMQDTVSTTSSLFKPAEFKYFYNVFTPFSDFAVCLPKQCVIGLGWGDEEDVIGGIGDWAQGGWGHLPRSDLAMSDKQLKLVEKAISFGRKPLLFSHFTFISYREEIPFSHTEEGDVEFDSGWDANRWDMGTFETNRKPMYEKHLCKSRDIQCVLTGHSHRKGIYSVLRVDYGGDNSVKTYATDFDKFSELRVSGKPVEPAVIVSDSGGSVPRYNMYGEFVRWGSDNPSGSKVTFGADGSISDISCVRTGVKPRFVVALDYMDIFEERVIREFKSKKVEIPFEQLDDADYDFRFWWKMIPEWMQKENKVWAKDIAIYTFAGKNAGWVKIQLGYDRGTNRWKIISRLDRYYFRKVTSRRQEGNFLAVKFEKAPGTVLEQYDFSSYWTFPVRIRQKKSGGEKVYTLKRSGKNAEIPNLGWRKKHDKYK